jgi:hypothetical protein
MLFDGTMMMMNRRRLLWESRRLMSFGERMLIGRKAKTLGVRY